MDSKVTSECIHADIQELRRMATGAKRVSVERAPRRILPQRARDRAGRPTEHYDEANLIFAKLGLLAGRYTTRL